MTLAPPLFRPLERLERRVLCALRFVDASTGALVREPLVVSVAGARVQRNRSALWVLDQVPALATHEAAFDAPPALLPLGSVALPLTVSDPTGRYLPRRAALALPRDAAPSNAATPASLFQPIGIRLFPAAAAAIGANWALLRVSVAEAGSGDALGGVLLRLTRPDAPLAFGLSDWRGEALVAVPGVPVTTWSTGPGAVVASEVDAQLDAVFDVLSGRRTPIARVRTGLLPAPLPMADPDDLDARRATLPGATRSVRLAAGRTETFTLALVLP